ncbi:unnamed protein product [Linum trigynum]|uniref:Uncharacterized protein n=1 Tax=Linum trigynum TaxID=586398 RepID=A0AAV2D9W6_9ROSI
MIATSGAKITTAMLEALFVNFRKEPTQEKQRVLPVESHSSPSQPERKIVAATVKSARDIPLDKEQNDDT